MREDLILFSVVIVDDDAAVEEWMKSEIEWSDLGFDVVSYANNGMDALHRLSLRRADLVITDITMPKMDGIELMNAINEQGLSSLVLFLSDADDYLRLKHALLLGGYNYIQKPLKKEKVAQALKKAYNLLLTQKAEQDQNTKLLEKFKLNFSYSREKILYDILRGKELPLQAFDDLINEYNINLYRRMVQVGILEIGNFDSNSREWVKSGKFEEMINEVRKIIQQVLTKFKDMNCVMVDMDIGVISVILQPVSNIDSKDFEDISADFFDKILKDIKLDVNVRVTIGVGNLQKNINDISLSYMGAKAALRHKYVLGGNRVIHINQSESDGKQNLLYPVEREKLLTEYIVSGDERAVKLAHNIFDEIMLASRDNVKRTAVAANQLVFNISQYIDNEHDFINKLCDFNKFINIDFSSLNSGDEIKEYFICFVTDLLSVVSEYKPSMNNALIKKACEYVLEHIEEEITLSTIANYLNISKNYFCSLFKQEIGYNFLEYVTKVKMEWAKRLLKDSGFKTYEVSEMLGYRESSYFSRLFRKYTGYSPAEYKKHSKTS
jgi:two-component system response regulator YesN